MKVVAVLSEKGGAVQDHARTAKTWVATWQISGHLPVADVQAFRLLAATLDMDVQELLAEALNMAFERNGIPNRIEITSGTAQARGLSRSSQGY